jgi:hypothetical protein
MKIAITLFMSLMLGSLIAESQPVFAVIKSNTKHKWQAEWNRFVYDEVNRHKEVFINNPNLPKADIERLYPGFFRETDEQKAAFWVLVIASIARFESAFDPSSSYLEPKSLNYYSLGLLQLSYIDTTAYRHLPLNEKLKNITDPKANLESGVIILAQQLLKRKVLFTKKYYYWSVLTNKQDDIVAFFKSNSAGLSP